MTIPFRDIPADSGIRPRGVVVLLHAFPLSARMWEPQFGLAASGWRVLAPELAPVEPGPRPRTMDDCAGAIVDMLDGLHVHDAVVVGLSMGGYAALALFRLAPRYARALVLCDTKPDADTPEGLEGRRRMQRLVREEGPSAVADELTPKLLGATTRATRPEVVEHVRSMIAGGSVDSIAVALDVLMSRQDSTPVLPSIHCPTLILVGEEDTVTPPALSRGMHAAIAGSRLETIAGAGHLSSLEQTDAFNARLSDFLEHRV